MPGGSTSEAKGLSKSNARNRNAEFTFTTRTYVHPENFARGSVVGSANAAGLNYALCTMMQEVERVELEYIKRGVEVQLPMLKEAVRSNISPAAKLCEFGVQVVEQSERKSLTKLNYQTLLNNIERFRKGTLVTDIDYQFLVAYDKWLRESGIAHNTRISRLRLLRALLNEAAKRDLIHGNPFDRFRIQQMVSKKGFLTTEQLHRLEKLPLKGQEDKVRDAFLIGCYTGLRFSDIITLRNDHIAAGWLTKKMAKTGYVVELPIAELFGGKMLDLLDKYNGNIERVSKVARGELLGEQGSARCSRPNSGRSENHVPLVPAHIRHPPRPERRAVDDHSETARTSEVADDANL